MLERYLITIRSFYLKTFQSKRTAYCIASIVLAVLSKGGIIFELDVFPSEDENCKVRGDGANPRVVNVIQSQNFFHSLISLGREERLQKRVFKGLIRLFF